MDSSFRFGEALRNSPHFDVCVVGHVTKDIVMLGDATRIKVGGTAYFTALAMQGLGLNVAVVTKGAERDREGLLRELVLRNIYVFWRPGKATTVFENRYGGNGLKFRAQVIKAMGTPFAPEDVGAVRAAAFHFGPLVRHDIPPQILKRVAGQANIVSLDVQGMVRPARLGAVTQEDWADKGTWLEFVDVLKADENEALIVSGETDARKAAAFLASLGPEEVIITLGSRGSLVYIKGALHQIPSFHPRRVVDPTGCGDTYMAGYLYERLKGNSPERAGRFAAAIAALKLEGAGPFHGSAEEVYALVSQVC